MSKLVPETAFALVCREGVTAELVRAYHDHLRETERALATTPGRTPLADRLDTDAAVEQSVPGEVLDVTPRIDEELLGLLEPDAIVAILDPAGPGFERVFDPEPLSALLDVLEHRREAYVAAHLGEQPGDGDQRSDAGPPPADGRVVTPELRFEADYVAPVAFAVARGDCGVQWAFFRSDDLRDVRWPDRL